MLSLSFLIQSSTHSDFEVLTGDISREVETHWVILHCSQEILAIEDKLISVSLV
jgi:hypothetical protein